MKGSKKAVACPPVSETDREMRVSLTAQEWLRAEWPLSEGVHRILRRTSGQHQHQHVIVDIVRFLQGGITPKPDNLKLYRRQTIQDIQFHQIKGKGVVVVPLSFWLASDLLPQGNCQSSDSLGQGKKSLHIGSGHLLGFNRI